VSHILAAIAVAFGASAVWLTVRITNRRERWAIQTAAGMLAIPLFYLLSFGPVCWWVAEENWPLHGLTISPAGSVNIHDVSRAPEIYWPLGSVMKLGWEMKNGPTGTMQVFGWYANLGCSGIAVPTDSTGSQWIVLLERSY
jgi:hypothetical protein